MAEKTAARKEAAHQTISCREISGLNCDYVAQADGNSVASIGFHVDQVMSLLGQHMGQAHQMGLSADERAEIRSKFPPATYSPRAKQ